MSIDIYAPHNTYHWASLDWICTQRHVAHFHRAQISHSNDVKNSGKMSMCTYMPSLINIFVHNAKESEHPMATSTHTPYHYIGARRFLIGCMLSVFSIRYTIDPSTAGCCVCVCVPFRLSSVWYRYWRHNLGEFFMDWPFWHLCGYGPHCFTCLCASGAIMTLKIPISH